MSLTKILHDLKRRLAQNKKLNLTDFFARARTRRELILAFLAALELVRGTAIKLVQNRIFGDIIAEVV